jgi:hypothetical protein
MTGTNPGAWPDQPPKWADDLEPPERLYTAAEMKAARLIAVERCRDAISDAWIDGPVTRAKCIDALEKLKEEIENEV